MDLSALCVYVYIFIYIYTAPCIYTGCSLYVYIYIYIQRTDKSLVRPGRKQDTATGDFEFRISYL